MIRFLAVVSVLALTAVTLNACGEDEDVLTVLAAASLNETFTELEQKFEAEHDGVDVRLAFDSSATLAAQAVEGGDADVLATADTGTMGEAVDGGVVQGAPDVFATNVATVVVPADNPGDIHSIGDLNGDVDYVICVPTAPCGKAAAALLPANDITAPPASEEVDVKAVLAKVTSGEADAGIVYVTDATAAGDAVTTVELPGAEDLRQEYPIAVLTDSDAGELARAWVDLVLSAAGQEVLAEAGFGQP